MRHIASIGVAAVLLAAGGCSFKTNGADVALSNTQRHPITVDQQVVTLTLSAEDADAGLSDLDRARIRAFARSYINNGYGSVSVTAPSGVGAGAATLAAEARQALNDNGIDYTQISAASYAASERVNRDIVLSYTHYVATASACGVWDGEDEARRRNLNSPNFGCFAQNNLAAMIGDPRDLVAPATFSDPDSQFRIRGVDAYREGDVTSSEADEDIAVQVAQ